MTQAVREVMTTDVCTCSADSTVMQAAQRMRDNDIGDVIVTEADGTMCGVVTDRDITVRAVADGHDPNTIRLADICSRDVVTIAPDQDVDEAVRLMRDRAVRRLPVCDDGTPVGIVSIGDLAIERDPESALADISAAPGNS